MKVRSQDIQKIQESPIELFYSGIKAEATRNRYHIRDNHSNDSLSHLGGKAIVGNKGVKVVRIVGIHDIVTTIESPTIEGLMESIRHIQKIPHVKFTTILVKNLDFG